MNERLDAEAEQFAANLSDLFRGSVGGDVGFEVVGVAGGERRKIGPGPFESGFQRVVLPRDVDPPDAPSPVSLKVEYDVGLDDLEDGYLTVVHSVFGIWVQPNPKGNARPVLRVEYDRDARSKPAAHVHLHAESVELGWLYGTAGIPLPSLSEIHFPVGGRRFRPTIEELLLFLDREGIFTDWVDPGWKAHVSASQDEWERRQARATARRHPEAVIEELERLGYQVAGHGQEG